MPPRKQQRSGPQASLVVRGEAAEGRLLGLCLIIILNKSLFEVCFEIYDTPATRHNTGKHGVPYSTCGLRKVPKVKKSVQAPVL